MKLLIGFPLVMVACLGVQLATEHIERKQAIEASLEACYDSPDTTDEECEAFADAGALHPSAQ